MRQKYVISRDGVKKELRIREYALLDNKSRKAAASVPQKAQFSFLCEETYENALIVSAMAKGMSDLIATLRTQNIFPIKPYSTKIAESVMALYDSSEEGSVELFFDDVDLVSA